MSQHLAGTVVLYPIRPSIRLSVSFTRDKSKFSSKEVCLEPLAWACLGTQAFCFLFPTCSSKGCQDDIIVVSVGSASCHNLYALVAEGTSSFSSYSSSPLLPPLPLSPLLFFLHFFLCGPGSGSQGLMPQSKSFTVEPLPQLLTYFFFFLFCSESVSYCVTQAALEPAVVLLPQPLGQAPTAAFFKCIF